MFSEGGTFFSVNDEVHFESDIMPSKSDSILSEGGLVPHEVVNIGRRVQQNFIGRYHAFRG